MRNCHLLLFCLIGSLVFSQKGSHALVVYVNDAESGLNVKDANVTLEGFELQPISGKYSKKDKFYYFDAVPRRYNTVMAYHDKYNEKGFQDLRRLPQTLTLKLYTPYRVKIPGDTANFYTEDASKLILVFDDPNMTPVSDCKDFGNNSMLCSANEYVRENYPEVIVKRETGFFALDYGGVLIEKAGGRKFKRFNDPVIKRMESDKIILVFFGLLLKTKTEATKEAPAKAYFSETGTPLYLPRYLRYVNFDTIDRAKKSIGGKSRNKYRGVNSDYRRKYFKGLLDNDLYRYPDRELDSLYAIDDEKKRSSGLFGFEPYPKDTICVNMYSRVSDMPSDSIKILPYKLIANLPEFYSLYLNNQRGRLAYSFYYSGETIQKYERVTERLEAAKTRSGSTVYRFKGSLASPYGMIDLTEYYNLGREAIYQKTESIFNP